MKDKYRRVIWRCNRKYNGVCKCGTPHLTEDQIIENFLIAFNMIFTEREELFATFDEIKDSLYNTDKLTVKQQELEVETALITEMVEQMVADNARKTQDQSEYNRKRNALVERFNIANKKLDKVNAELIELLARKSAVEHFLDSLRNMNAPVTEFSDNLWLNTITSVTVHQSGELAFTFKDGTEVKV